MKIIMAVVLAGIGLFPQADNARAVTTCDYVVQVGDSLTSMTPTTYVDAYTLAGFPKVIVLGGAGRGINMSEVYDSVAAVNIDGANGVFPLDYWHHDSLDDVAMINTFRGQSGICWVIQTGTNNVGHMAPSTWDSLITQMQNMIGDAPALWVNVWVNSPDYPNYSPSRSAQWNNKLVQHGLDVVDWAAYASVHPELFDAGGIHLTPAGYTLFSWMIAGQANTKWNGA